MIDFSIIAGFSIIIAAGVMVVWFAKQLTNPQH
jgi:hypothetical protein